MIPLHHPRRSVHAAVLVSLFVLGVALTNPAGAWAAAEKDVTATPRNAPRIVALLPSLTEIVYAIGAADTLVGVDAKSDYPAAALALPRVGGFQGISLETVVKLRPTHILVMEGYHVADYKRLAGFGAELVRCRFDDLDDVGRCTLRIGEITGRQAAAQKLVAGYGASRARVAAQTADRMPLKTLILVSADPLYAAGDRSFSGDMLRLAGGVNALAGATAAYPLISGESIVAMNPAVIITLAPGDRERLLAITGLGSVEAIQKGRVHSVSENIFSRPGPRAFEALEELAAILHGPDIP
jgi:ABC-type Fe3+-hydroxamate transport system substrate-binding protein